MATAMVLGTALFVSPAAAQISISSLPGGSYNQNFDSLANTGTANAWMDNATFPGWYAATNTTSGVALTYAASAGTDTKGQIYSYGMGGSTERALGSIASGTSGTLAYGVRFANDTGSDIGSILISYTGEQWRNGGNVNPQTLAFSCLVSSTPITSADSGEINSWTAFTALDFSTPTVGATASALDGNAAVNRQTFSAVQLKGVVVPAGSEIFLRWKDINDASNDHGIAVDDLTVTFASGAIVTNAPTYATVNPAAQTNNAGATAIFSVSNDGTPLVSIAYQWRKNGTPLADGGNLWGSATPTLTLTNVLAADAGSYDVVVANSAGSVTSTAATLTVADPVISSQSGNQARLGGESVTFLVIARGTPTLTYQWYLGSTAMDGETGNSLSLTDLQPANQGTYTCWVTNGLGVGVASAPIVLTVTAIPSVTIAQWDFNDTNAPVTAPPPTIGSGTAALVGGVTAAFASGVSSDPGGTNRAWNTSSYPSQGTGNKTAGVQFNVSTLGYQNISLTWNERHSSTASRYTRLQYSADGTTFTDLELNAMTVNDTFFLLPRDLVAIPAVNNNPNFAFRIVSEFESEASPFYVGTTGDYRTAGTVRFDLVTVYGDPLGAVTPAPTTISSLIGGTLTYGGGAGTRFVLLTSPSAAAPLSSWIRVATNSATPGVFSVPTGSENARFYRIKSE